MSKSGGFHSFHCFSLSTYEMIVSLVNQYFSTFDRKYKNLCILLELSSKVLFEIDPIANQYLWSWNSLSLDKTLIFIPAIFWNYTIEALFIFPPSLVTTILFAHITSG